MPSQKPMSERDANQVLTFANNDVNDTVGVDGFIVGLVGRKIELALSTTTLTNDTETYTFSESGNVLYSIRIIYTTGTRDIMLSAERIS